MNIPFKAISLSHKKASLKVRERFAMNVGARKRLLQYAKDLGIIDEMLILSTCNRFEVYFNSQTVTCEQLTSLLNLFINASETESPLQYFTRYDDPVKAVEHLFKVAAGLDSQVLGDAQIITQVKQAYQNSVDLSMAGPFLHRLMHTIFHTHKRVTLETRFKDCHASITGVTKHLVNRILPDRNATILVLGAGKIGEDLCRKLSKLGYRVWVSNRTEATGFELASELDLKPIPFGEIPLFLKEVQLVISALSVDEPFLTKNCVNRAGLNSHTYLIDLSVPRSIADEVAEHPNISLLNMEDINDRISSSLKKRKKEIPKVEAIIDREISKFVRWSNELRMSSTIQQIKTALERIRTEEIAHHLKNKNLPGTNLIHTITKSIVDRVIRLPALKLKVACKRGEEETMAEVLKEIFTI